MNYKKPKRIFEDSGTVDPKMSYHVELENVVNTKNRLSKPWLTWEDTFQFLLPGKAARLLFLKIFAMNLKKILPMWPSFLVFRTAKTLIPKDFIN